MMALIFAMLTVALAALLLGPRWLAIAAAVLCLALAAGLFLFEIHSPDDGFALPWLQVRAAAPEPVA